MKFRGGIVGDEATIIETEALMAADAARTIADQYGLDEWHSYDPESVPPCVWTELIDAGPVQLPVELYRRRTWRVEVVRSLRLSEKI